MAHYTHIHGKQNVGTLPLETLHVSFCRVVLVFSGVYYCARAASVDAFGCVELKLLQNTMF